jgi:hypothetical protein
MKCTNKYEALVPEALGLVDEVRAWFAEFVGRNNGMEIRELEYLAMNAISGVAAELVLLKALKKKRRSRLRSNGKQ